MSKPGVLHGTVQAYAWGSREALPRIMGVAPTGEPQAELWLGAHPRGPSVLRRGGADRCLDEVIAADPVGELGAETARLFRGELPFLLKILAVELPLSLQVHPSRQQARAGFDAEDERGVPIDAGHRSYRDRNHKPELICALEPFTAFCGFRPPSTAAELFESLEIPDLAPAMGFLRKGQVKRALQWLLERSPSAGAEIAEKVVEACAKPGPFPNERRWAVRIGRQHPGDAGVAIALMLNLVELSPGQALFLGAGNLHVYLHGVAMEIMANSDNVLRGGLTVKHVDVPALLDVVDCTAGEVPVSAPDGPFFAFRPPVPDFCLTRIEVADSVRLHPTGPEIVLCASGRVSAAGFEITGGQAVWLPAGVGEYRIFGAGLVFRAQTNLSG
ncbi:mannose-6-phosphate isomerase, class I [Candidatus Poriferisocius sp.]|uniref:mannose-6-phosphate isomerase, class I n=1 Tax=Candidatus Poriferisocius sp. TaxID=3101276 RepID=UPI003B016BAC